MPEIASVASMTTFAQVAALIAVLGTAVVYGTDTFCALVQRPALAAVDDATLVAVMGNVHRYGDRRMPLPGVIGGAGAAISAALAAAVGNWAMAIPAAAAFGFLVVWIALYTRISAPINKRLTAAADTGVVPADARVLQRDWDAIINARAILQGLAVVALCLALLN